MVSINGMQQKNLQNGTIYFPPEIIAKIMSYLGKQDLLLNVNPVNKLFNNFAMDTVFSDGYDSLRFHIRNGRYVKHAIKIALRDMQSKKFGDQYDALFLFQRLVRKGNAFKEAKQAVCKGLQNNNYFIFRETIVLLTLLVKKGQALEEGSKIFQEKWISFISYADPKIALPLLATLVRNGLFLDEGICFVRVILEDKKLKMFSMDILTAFVRRGIHFELAKIEVLKFFEKYKKRQKKCAKGPCWLCIDDIMGRRILKLFIELAKQGLVLDDAMNAAQSFFERNKRRTWTRSDNHHRGGDMMVKYAIKLFSEMVKRGKGLKDAKEAVTWVMEGPDSAYYINRGIPDVRSAAKNLQKLLDLS